MDICLIGAGRIAEVHSKNISNHNKINYGVKGNQLIKQHFEMRLESERNFSSFGKRRLEQY